MCRCLRDWPSYGPDRFVALMEENESHFKGRPKFRCGVIKFFFPKNAFLWHFFLAALPRDKWQRIFGPFERQLLFQRPLLLLSWARGVFPKGLAGRALAFDRSKRLLQVKHDKLTSCWSSKAATQIIFFPKVSALAQGAMAGHENSRVSNGLSRQFGGSNLNFPMPPSVRKAFQKISILFKIQMVKK